MLEACISKVLADKSNVAPRGWETRHGQNPLANEHTIVHKPNPTDLGKITDRCVSPEIKNKIMYISFHQLYYSFARPRRSQIRDFAAPRQDDVLSSLARICLRFPSITGD